MRPRATTYCLVLFAILSLSLTDRAALAADPVPLKAGFAEADISPDAGMESPGNYGKGFRQKTHDPCKVRAAVFDDGKQRVALVEIDALTIPRAMVMAARKRIQEQCGIAPEAVLVAASHSHTSGPTGMVQPGQFDHASELVRYLAYERSSCANAAYLKRVEDQIVAAVCAADRKRADAACGVDIGHENRVAFNRRFRMKNGQTWTHPGKRNPDIVEPAGPIDPDVGVVGAWNKEGKLLGCVVNYALHGTTGADGFSANWIYDMEQTIRRAVGPDVVVVFLNGDCGDVTQVDNLSPYPNIEATVVGGRLGAEAVKVLASMPRGALGPVLASSKVLNIARRRPKSEKVAKALAAATQDRKTVGTWEKETLLLDAIIAKQPAAEVEVQAIQVGPAVFVSNPAEMFVHYGLELKRQSPFQYTFPVELANGCVGYVPTLEAFGEHGGGYETRLTSYSNLEITAGEQMLKAGLALIRKMSPSKAPTPDEFPPQTTPWDYGNVAPELE
jgi:neutral ceramidase